MPKIASFPEIYAVDLVAFDFKLEYNAGSYAKKKPGFSAKSQV